jgi:uncharacterized repeat protein (TIGR01451 family)
MAGGDFANTDFSAAAPYTYNHQTGGGAYNDRTVGDYKDITEQLEGGQFAFGDVISYLVQVTMEGTTVDSVQSAEFDFGFLAESTGQTGAAQVKILNVGVNYGDVENGDNATGLNPGKGQYGLDSGISDDKQGAPNLDKNGAKGSTAILVPGSEKIVKPTTGEIVDAYTKDAELRGTIRVDDLEAGEKVILRIDVLLEGKPGTSPTGNLQGSLLAGRAYKADGTVDTINTGNQTIPFLKIGEIAGAGKPLLDLQKTVTTDLTGADQTGVENLTVNGGTTVRYLYNVTNDGTMPLYDVNIVDDNGTPGNIADDFTVNLNNKLSGTLVNLDGEATANDLAAGETAIFYADVPLNNTGLVTNIGTATGNNNLSGGQSETLTDNDTANVQVEGTPSLNIVKTANPTSVDQVGQVITYTYAVENTGTLPLTGITVTDDNHTPGDPRDDITPNYSSGDGNNNSKLDVGETWTYTSTYSVTQADLQNGQDLVNIATADSDQTGPDTDNEVVDVIQKPSLNVEKTSDVEIVDAAGDVINYTYALENTGNIALSEVTLTDDNFTSSNTTDDFTPTYSSGDTNTNNLLDVGETWTYTHQHTVTQAEINAGNDLVNIATADSNQTDPDTDDAKVNVKQDADLFLQKDADVSEVDAVGDVINYTYTLKNEGNIALSGINLTDDNFTSGNTTDDFNPIYSSGDTNTNNLLDVGETWTYTHQHTVTQTDLDNGVDLVNIATADSAQTNPTTDNATVDVLQQPGFNLVKDADVTQVDEAGDTINYTYNLENTGNISLSGISVVDDNFTPDNTSDDITLAVSAGDTDNDGQLDVGETWTYNHSYTVTQDNITNGTDLVNVATATSDQTEPDTDDATVDVLRTPDLTIVKTADTSVVNAADQNITYTYTVENTGNVPLTNVSVTDDNFTSDNTADDFPPAFSGGDTNNDQVLDLDETWTYSYTHPVTQADIDSGKAFVNVATADSDQTDPKTDDEVVTVQQIPNFSVAKVADVTEVDGAGDVINYTYTVANTGNVTLTDVSLSDDNFTPENTGDDFSPSLTAGDNGNGLLEVGETWTYQAAYTVTQADIDNGLDLTNVVTADTTQTNPSTAEETVDVIQTPGMAVVKTADVASVDGAGDVINYTYTVANTGNVSLTDVVLVDDNFTPDTSDDSTLTPTNDNGNGILDVGETWTYSQSYTVTQQDIDTGLDLTNVAIAASNETPPASDDETVDVVQNPNLSIEKTANIAEVNAAGANIEYTYTVANTGNVTLENVTLIDDHFTPDDTSDDFAPDLESGDSNNNGKLDVGETWTYTANYTVNQADIDAGNDLRNVVVADSNQTEPEQDDYKVNVIQEADLYILKEANVTEVDAAGDEIVYNYTVKNTGNTTLTNVTLTDDNFTPANPSDDFNPTWVDKGDGNNDELNIQETWRYEDTYTVTQADMDSGVPLVNVATATSNQTSPQTDDETVNILQNPQLSVEKNANVTEVDGIEDVIQYTYTVSNTGNVTLENISLKDDNFTPNNPSDDFDPTFKDGDSNGNSKLDVGENWNYTASHTVTQADLNQGQPLVNVATADSNLTDPETDNATVNVIIAPGIAIDKVTSNGIVTGDGIGVTANTPVTWTYSVTNTGDIDLSNIAVTDDKQGSINNIVTQGNGDSILSPNEIWTFQANGTAITGSYANTGTVTGSHPNGNVTDADASSYTGLTAPGVRTPGFWVNWPEVWDGNATNDKRFAGRSGFPISDILLEPYSNSEQAPKVVDPVTGQYTTGLLVGDYNRDGITNNGEKTIFYTLDEAKSIVGASNKVQADKRYTLDRSLVASWLNYLGFNPAPVNDINNGIAWLQQHSPDENADGIGDGNLVLNASTYGFPASSPYWNQASGSLPSGNSIHTALDSYNNGLWSPV